MFVARNNDGSIYGAWRIPQTESQRELGVAHPDWENDDDPEVLAFMNRPLPIRTAAQKLAALGLTPDDLKTLLGLE